ncbi:unnamed protein product [Umbelopsis ramanniana]
MDASASKQLLECLNSALLCPPLLTIPAQQKDLTNCTEALVCHIKYNSNGHSLSLEEIRDNCTTLSAQFLEAFTVCSNPEIFDQLLSTILSLEIDHEYPCRNTVVNMLIEATRKTESSVRKRWALSLIRKHCHFLFVPSNHRPEDIPIRKALFSLCYDEYMHGASSDIKLMRLLEAILYELHVSEADWKAKAAADNAFVIRKCINDCEDVLNSVVDKPSQFALHAQRFQELIPYNWIVHMPSILILISLYGKLYPDKLHPFLDHLKKNGMPINPSNTVFSKQMNALLSAPESSIIAVECACLEIESAIVYHRSEISIDADALTAVDGLDLLHNFHDDVIEQQSKDAFVQQVCLLISSAPPSQMAKVSWVTIAAFTILASWDHSHQTENTRGYSTSIAFAMVSKITDLLKDLVFTLPCCYEIDDAMLRPMIATVSAYAVALRSSVFQAHTHEDTFRLLKMDIEKVWRNHRTQRRAFLVTHSKYDLQNEDICSRSIYGVLLVMSPFVPHPA